MATKKSNKKGTGAGKRPAAKKSAAKSKAKTPVKSSAKPQASVRKKGAAAATKRGSAKPAPKKNIFAGASEISITENKIAVTKSSARSGKDKYSEEKTRTYHDKTQANMRAVKELMTPKKVKKVTVKLK